VEKEEMSEEMQMGQEKWRNEWGREQQGMKGREKKVRNGRVRESTRGRKPCVVCSNSQSRGGKNRRLERGGKKGENL